MIPHFRRPNIFIPNDTTIIGANGIPVENNRNRILIFTKNRFLNFTGNGGRLNNLTRYATKATNMRLCRLLTKRHTNILRLRLRNSHLILSLYFYRFTNGIHMERAMAGKMRRPLQHGNLGMPVTRGGVFYVTILYLIAGILYQMINMNFNSNIHRTTTKICLPNRRVHRHIATLRTRLPNRRGNTSLITMNISFHGIRGTTGVRRRRRFLGNDNRYIRRNLFFVHRMGTTFFRHIFPIFANTTTGRRRNNLTSLDDHLCPILLRQRFYVVTKPIPPGSQIRIISENNTPTFVNNRCNTIRLHANICRPLCRISAMQNKGVTTTTITSVGVILLRPTGRHRQHERVRKRNIIIILRRRTTFHANPSNRHHRLQVTQFANSPSTLLLHRLHPTGNLRRFTRHLVSPINRGHASVVGVCTRRDGFHQRLR